MSFVFDRGSEPHHPPWVGADHEWHRAHAVRLELLEAARVRGLMTVPDPPPTT
jgi:hypothetical protein